MRARGVTLLAIAAVAFCLLPFAWQVLTSLRVEHELTDLGIPSQLGLESYRSAFRLQPFARVLLNSTLVSTSTTLFALLLGAPAAFALAKLKVRGRAWILGATLAISMFPPIATVSPMYLLLKKLALLDHWVALVLPDTTFALPLTIWLLHRFFADVPDDLMRAARMDGCSPFRALRSVFLPVAMPGLATTAILVFVFSWNELLYALTFVSSPDRRTVPAAIALFSAEHKEPWGEIAAASVIATLPLVIVTLIFQRRIRAGLTAGAVKG